MMCRLPREQITSGVSPETFLQGKASSTEGLFYANAQSVSNTISQSKRLVMESGTSPGPARDGEGGGATHYLKGLVPGGMAVCHAAQGA